MRLRASLLNRHSISLLLVIAISIALSVAITAMRSRHRAPRNIVAQVDVSENLLDGDQGIIGRWDVSEREALDLADTSVFVSGWHPAEGAISYPAYTPDESLILDQTAIVKGTNTIRWISDTPATVEVWRAAVNPLRLEGTILLPGEAIPAASSKARIRVYAQWNGVDIGSVELGTGNTNVKFEVPVAVQRIGLNQLSIWPSCLLSGASLPPAHQRKRACGPGFRRLALVSTGNSRSLEGPPITRAQGQLIQRAGSVLGGHFLLPEGARVRASGRFKGSSVPNDAANGLAIYSLDDNWQQRQLALIPWRELTPDRVFNLEFEVTGMPAGRFVGLYSALARPADAAADFNASIEWTKFELCGTKPAVHETPRSVQRPALAKNVLMVLFDTMRADHVEPFGRAADTPSLKRLADSGAAFFNAHALTSWTRSSVATMMTSLEEPLHGVRTHVDSLPALASLTYLPQVLRERGFNTVCLTFNAHTSASTNFDRGYDSFEYITAESRESDLIHKLIDPAHVGEYVWKQKLAPHLAPDKPFFIYLHEIDPHGPYTPPPPYDVRYAPNSHGPTVTSWPELLQGYRQGRIALTDNDRAWVHAEYRGEVAFMDAYLDSLLAAMAKDGALKDTLVVFVSDHGEEFTEHGGYQHGETLYEEVLRIPLIMSLPGAIPPGLRIEQRVTMLDVAPTILDVLGLSIPQTMRGHSARPLLEGAPSLTPDAHYYAWLNQRVGGRDNRPAYLRAIQVGDEKLIWTFGEGKNQIELFNLSTDPLESRNKFSSAAITSSGLRQLLVQQMRSMSATQHAHPLPATQDTSTTEEIEALRALGYVR